jgi:hypothetical protein
VIRYRVDVVLSLNASENGEPDQPIDACLIPSQLLATELLRRPLEYAQVALVGVVDQTSERLPAPDGHVEGVHNELCP